MCKFSLWKRTYFGLSLLLFSGCGLGQRDNLKVGEEVLVDQTSFSFASKDFNIFSEYRISPGDQLDVLFAIQTWEKEDQYLISLDDTVSVKFVHAPELNELQKVRPDGRISLPYLGEYLVAGRSTKELEKDLMEKYAKILIQPELYVVIPEYLSQLRELKQDLHTATRGLSRLVTVRPDGYTTFPMVGDVMVADKTIPEVSMYLNTQFAKISPSLHCDLFLEKHAGSVVYVMGEVKNPGALEVRKPISILEALTMAGSFTPKARLDNVVIMRRHENKLVATRVDATQILHLTQQADLFYIKSDDIIYVPATALANGADLMNQLADALWFKGWSFGLTWTTSDAPLLGSVKLLK
ncbi:MAG: polysaccharide biosynthesis/export family protein [Magnetococcus sp. DMHC-6]